jgi:hypothetical protein
MGHYSRECPNLLALATRENAGSFIRRFSAKEKGKAQVHLIKPMNEGCEKALMGLEKSLKIPKDAIDVMTQIKRPVEGTSHLDTIVKRFKEMAKAPKEKKRNRRQRFGFQDFPISKNAGPYSVVKDVGS